MNGPLFPRVTVLLKFKYWLFGLKTRGKLHFFIINRFTSNQPSDGKLLSNFSGLKHLSLSNNKNYRLKKEEFFLCNKRKVAVKPTIHQNYLKNIIGKIFLKSVIININFES